MVWLVTGGAGYIGAHVVAELTRQGMDLVVLDDLSSGEAARVPGVELVVGSVLDRQVLSRLFDAHAIRGVVHLAAKKQVAESVSVPLHYYEQNVEGLRRLLDVSARSGVQAFLFSSSAAVYGSPDDDQVTELAPCAPESPYGTTKLVGEWMVRDVARASGMRYANLRYFNVAGAAGPLLSDRGTSNLVPMVFERLGRGLPPQIFGDDYPTEDGTCVRDFVHVQDVATAHVLVAQRLADSTLSSSTLNLGRGTGVSVRQMVELIGRVTGTADNPALTPVVAPRRPGDPARVVASAEEIHRLLGWRARLGPQDMVESAWEGWVAAKGPRGVPGGPTTDP